MPLLLRTHYKLSKTAIKENRTRSFLTCLGIAIGVASIILILSLMGSCVGPILQGLSTNMISFIIWRSFTGFFAGSLILGQAYSFIVVDNPIHH